MTTLSDAQQAQAQALSKLSYCNPFLPERIDYEREILGDAFSETDRIWHRLAHDDADRPNLLLLTERSKELANAMREGVLEGQFRGDKQRALYEDVALYYLYNKHEPGLWQCVVDALASDGAEPQSMGFYDRFLEDMEYYFALPGLVFSLDEADHLFACFFQLRRAFYHTFENIIGGSMASAHLRAAVWQSIFTSDMRRYRRVLFNRMGDITTLITGPSGTGKELVASAIGLSRYIPFDAKTRKPTENFRSAFRPLNLSALSPTLIESELFGHTKGSFTGALKDRVGFFEVCPPCGTVFLDEIGDLALSIQVKLLRVLQTRSFHRIGETKQLDFLGKIVAATNKNLMDEMSQGNFREDLYYRLCSDIVETPSLREQIAQAPEQLRNLLRFIARRVVGDDEASALAQEVGQWIDKNLPDDYPWPGNVRELEQCVRNIMVRNTYKPPQHQAKPSDEAFLDKLREGSLTADEVLEHYCTLVYAKTGSYQETGRRLGLDRRTVKARVDEELLAQLGQDSP